MNRFTTIVTAALISTTAMVPLQALAQVSINLNIGSEPPPPRYERIPASRQGYIWAPGYWDWNGHSHAWREGHWERARSGYVYERSEWRQDNGQWHLNKGGWKQAKKRHKQEKHEYHCPPGQAKKGNC